MAGREKGVRERDGNLNILEILSFLPLSIAGEFLDSLLTKGPFRGNSVHRLEPRWDKGPLGRLCWWWVRNVG